MSKLGGVMDVNNGKLKSVLWFTLVKDVSTNDYTIGFG